VANTAWSPDGQFVAFAMDDGSVKTFAHDGLIMSLNSSNDGNGQTLPVQALAWSNNNVLATASTNTIWIQDQNSPTPSTLGPMAGNIQALAWLTGNRAHLLTAVNDQGELYVYDTTDGDSLWSERSWSGYGVLACSPDGAYLATQSPPGSDSSQGLMIWEVNTGLSFTSIQTAGMNISALVWASDSRSIAVMGADGTLQVWDIQNRQKTFSQQLNTQQSQLAWSPDQHFLAAIDDAYNLLILDRSNGNTLLSTPLTMISQGSVFTGHALSWLPDSQTLVLATSKMDCLQFKLSWF
ncbi:MAG TPA: hypothetical protein VHD63_09635, partial [Ktedonobacteraceae bacterium]|nr:hypothetical protein [Ktedonobacteraceae bacterium]